MNFWGVDIHWNPKDQWLYQTDYIENFLPKETITGIKRLRESCRIIKQEFTKDNNAIEALEFHKSEMYLYYKELKCKLKINNETGAKSWKHIVKQKFTNSKYYIINFLSHIDELITLWFNKVSNHFGTNWISGVKFTLIVTLLFYIVFLLSLSHDLAFEWSGVAISATFKHFVEFLNITNWSIKPFGVENYNWAYIILFIGRIFIGYGYYQTIQAFRKYGKN